MEVSPNPFILRTLDDVSRTDNGIEKADEEAEEFAEEEIGGDLGFNLGRKRTYVGRLGLVGDSD